ncbi:protein FAM227A-like [Engraulis encrasicolus]|uniref:protein FAM227A-like n=1 Tax=Engraulis encrasicolus TaxID=184585 RepID=UPI002FD49AAB
MDEINAVCAPTVVFVEDVSNNPVVAERKKKSLREESLKPVPCLIGSISELNQRMASIDYVGLNQDLGLKWRSAAKQASRQASKTGLHGTKPVADSKPIPAATVSEKREGGMPRLVELYQFPGYDPDLPMPLPHSTSFSTVVAHVVRAQPRLDRKPKYKATFQSMLSSAVMEEFVKDMFYWLFLQNFQPDGRVQDSLFSRVADSYIRILTHDQSSSRTGDVFLRDFPNILSQSLYSCFCCCFPQSCSTIRNGSFLHTMCSTAYQWTGGIYPSPNVYMKWDFEALEPDDVTTAEFTAENEGGKEKESVSTIGSLMDCTFLAIDNDKRPSLGRRSTKVAAELGPTSSERTLCDEQTPDTSPEKEEESGPEDMKGSDQKAAPDQSSTKESQTDWYEQEFEQCVFNMWGKSPLVQHFLEKMDLEHNVGQDILVRRTQVKHPPPSDKLTYHQVKQQCWERSAVRWHDVKTMMARCDEELAFLQRKRAEFRYLMLRKQQRILSEPCSVKQFCQKLFYPDEGTAEGETERIADSS